MINFKDLKLKVGNFLALLIKPIYSIFTLIPHKLGYMCWGTFLGCFFEFHCLFICYRNKEQPMNVVQSRMLSSGATAADPPGLRWAL